MTSDFNPLYLCNYDTNYTYSGDKFLDRLQKGQWTIENRNMCNEILATKLESEPLAVLLKSYLAEQSTKTEVLHMALSAFLKYLSINWDSHPMPFSLVEYFGMEWPTDVDASTLLQRDSEPLYVNILFPELLYFSLQIITGLHQIEQQNLLYLWWSFRIKTTHQRALEDDSALLFSELEVLIAKLSNEVQNSQPLTSRPRLRVLLYAEISQAYLLYRRVQKTEDFLVKARETVGLKLEMTGVLGKRTKFQQMLLPQLALSSELIFDEDRPPAEESHRCTELPPDIELQDDVRLNKIEYSEKISQAELPSLEQTLCLLTVQYLQKAQPKDALMDEELLPYIQAVLAPKSSAWPTRVAALLVRSKVEANHKRTVERAMQQCETIVNDKTRVSDTSRVSYLWASGLPASWVWRQALAELYLSLGLTKAALEEYRRLRCWEDVVACYTLLQLRHKAAEVIQQQIDIKPTVKLYCLLGDATDEISWYEMAWEFSGHKSSRAQRHWGNYLFNRKLYTESIPHFERSLEINSIQDRVWLRLAYAALETENWDVSARAYRRYTYLQPNTFEAWNNLAKVYVKQGDKNRAYRALMESLRFNYDNWKLWENVIIISMETLHFEDVMRAIHRLIDIRHKYDDLQVLGLLVRAVVEDKTDADGNSSARLRKRMLELFGRVSGAHANRPEIWQMYADLSPTYLLKAQRLLKAYKGYSLSGSWSNNPESSKQVVELASSLLECSLQARREADDKDRLQADQQLSSARLTGQAVIRAAEKHNWPETEMLLEQLRTLLNTVTEYMKSNNS